MRRGLRRAALALLPIGALLIAVVAWLNLRDEDAIADAGPAAPPVAAQVERGAYLARAGNCMGCHTMPGGAAYAGGRGVPTPFGTVYAPNLTPDVATGLGAWSAAEFWRALHNGRSRDGRLLYPAFPYPNYTRITRADADAIHAFLRSLPAVAQPNRAHALRFPFNQQAALALWRALYFQPARHEPDSSRDADWNRGAYLVEGLGHCNACHASRNALGATPSTLDLAGGLIPVQNWYAPSLTSPLEAGVADWRLEQIVELLQHGISTRGVVLGPMSEVVSGSTQHLSAPDLRAMASYLKALPQIYEPVEEIEPDKRPPLDARGAELYEQHCVRCHGEQGEGVTSIYAALAGNRAVTMSNPANLVHVVLEGGFAPATAGHPRPFGMPPFATVLSNADVAHLLTYLRAAWGHQASAVSALEVSRYRSAK